MPDAQLRVTNPQPGRVSRVAQDAFLACYPLPRWIRTGGSVTACQIAATLAAPSVPGDSTGGSLQPTVWAAKILESQSDEM